LVCLEGSVRIRSALLCSPDSDGWLEIRLAGFR
jgi:hypothetical protein